MSRHEKRTQRQECNCSPVSNLRSRSWREVRTKDWPTAHRSAPQPPIDRQGTIVGPWPFRAPWVYCFGHFLNRHLCDAVLTAFDMMKMKGKSELGSVAAILERELGPTIKEWLRRVNLVSELTDIPLSDDDRTSHLSKLYSDLISRLRLPNDADAPTSVTAAAHGQRRREQGYSPAMLVEESRKFQVVTFGMLHLHLSELDQRRLLLDVVAIADEADAQLMGAVRSLTARMPPTPHLWD